MDSPFAYLSLFHLDKIVCNKYFQLFLFTKTLRRTKIKIRAESSTGETDSTKYIHVATRQFLLGNFIVYRVPAIVHYSVGHFCERKIFL